MLTVRKIKGLNVKKIVLGLFAIGVITGVGVPFAYGAGAGSASAATGTTAQASAQTASGAAVTYVYGQIPMTEAYPLYITASFTVAGGLFIYALTYVPARARARSQSQYASRVATWAKTTY